MDIYLDIETSFDQDITVIGILYATGRVVQLVGRQVTKDNLAKSLQNADKIYTYNGSRFDLPVIKKKLKLDIESEYQCHDLMYDCWECGLKGGLKSVEKQVGIRRDSYGVDGYQAMELWKQYVMYDDTLALEKLLEYNRDDIQNLVKLRKVLVLNKGI